MICKNCGNEIKKNRHNRKNLQYCSRECYLKQNKWEGNLDLIKKMYFERICLS